LKKAKLLTILFRDFIVYNFIFTLAGGYYLWFFEAKSYPYLFWIKIIGYVVLGLWYFQSRKERLYFYHNMGWTIKSLIFYTILIDSMITVMFYALVYAIT